MKSALPVFNLDNFSCEDENKDILPRQRSHLIYAMIKYLYSAVIVVCCTLPLLGDPPSTVFPAHIVLHGTRQQQQIVILPDGKSERSSVAKATYESENARIAVVDAMGVVHGVAQGKSNIRVTIKERSVRVPVEITDLNREPPVSFSREVVPILTKYGCNSGACHGAQLGRGGFRLSLFGFDPQFDYSQIVQSAEGRRVVLSNPDRSIFLRKPTLQMEHGGGEKLRQGGREYHVLKQWLEDGAPEPKAEDPKVVTITVTPESRLFKAGEEQQLAVTADWSDGTQTDITATALYDTLNETVAQVTPTGLVRTMGGGDTYIMIRFLGQVAVARMTQPFRKVEQTFDFTPQNDIDKHLAEQWRNLGLVPSPACSDSEFLRRLYLDIIGTLPTAEEARSFLKDNAIDKRARAIDRVFDRPEFVDYWTLKWGDLLRINRDALQDKGMWSFHNWVRASIRDNKPIDQFVREIVTAEGSTFTDGPANYYQIGRNAEEWAETTSQVFLGVRMQCAHCHHHPFEKWSQDDYYGMAAFFSRMSTKTSTEFGLFVRENVIFLRPTGDISNPRTRQVVKPHPLDGTAVEDLFDRRRKLAEWMTNKDNPFFARNIVNRFWGYLMGRGLVEPLDDMRATNPATNPALLDALAKDFIEHHYDLKYLLKTIVRSRAWQARSAIQEGNAIDVSNVYFCRFTTKRLTAEQLADGIDYATGSREKYIGLPLGTRAIQLPDSRVQSFFLDVFGRPARQIACECERTTQPNIAQALHLLNGNYINRKLADPKGRIDTIARARISPTEAVEELYLVTLSRLPKQEEMQLALRWLQAEKDPKLALRDLLWALLNSKEFLFNH